MYINGRGHPRITLFATPETRGRGWLHGTTCISRDTLRYISPSSDTKRSSHGYMTKITNASTQSHRHSSRKTRKTLTDPTTHSTRNYTVVHNEPIIDNLFQGTPGSKQEIRMETQSQTGEATPTAQPIIAEHHTQHPIGATAGTSAAATHTAPPNAAVPLTLTTWAVHPAVQTPQQEQKHTDDQMEPRYPMPPAEDVDATEFLAAQLTDRPANPSATESQNIIDYGALPACYLDSTCMLPVCCVQLIDNKINLLYQ